MLKGVAEFLNSIETRVWGVLMVLIGAALLGFHQAQGGMMIIGGGMAIFQGKPQ